MNALLTTWDKQRTTVEMADGEASPRFLSMSPKVIVLLLLGGILGCGQKMSDEDRAAFGKLKEAIAAVKVSTHGSTYNEFRQKRLALDTCYEANKAKFTTVSNECVLLSELASACDYFRQHEMKYPTIALSLNFPGELDKMRLICPEVTNKFGLTSEQRNKDQDFYAPNYVKWSMTKINAQCDLLLSVLGKQ